MARTIIAVVDDLFFAAKIRGAAEQAEISLSFARNLDALLEDAIRRQPDLIICDLNCRAIDPIAAAKQLKSNEQTAAISLLGFFAHVQTELQNAAASAGFDQILPRSAFSRLLPLILSGEEGKS